MSARRCLIDIYCHNSDGSVILSMREYGGYLEYERYYGKEYHQALRFDSMRSSLAYVIEQKKYRYLYIPYYMCDCIGELLDNWDIKYSYYNIDEDFLPLVDTDSMQEDECLLLVNYYSQLEDDIVISFKERCNVFLDNTQSFWNKPVFGVDAANSCRKFLGVSGGSYLYTDLADNDLERYDHDIVCERVLATIGRFETNASSFYGLFSKSEEILRGSTIKRMSRFDLNILRSLDYDRIINRRKDNYTYLAARFGSVNKLSLKNFAGLFMYPLLVDGGRFLKRMLISEKIYVPTLWPGVEKFEELNSFERDLVENLVLLPLDQRYDVSDMDYIATVVERYIE